MNENKDKDSEEVHDLLLGLISKQADNISKIELKLDSLEEKIEKIVLVFDSTSGFIVVLKAIGKIIGWVSALLVGLATIFMYFGNGS